MNQQAGRVTLRKARPVKPSDRVERFYRSQLRFLIRHMARAVAESVVPVLKAEKQHYVNDGYRKGLFAINGLYVFVEYEAGTSRHPGWEPLKHHYGHIKGAVSADDEYIDVFMSDDAGDASLPVFVVDQVKQDGSFDEHKVLLGFQNIESAREAYLSNYPSGWAMGNITEMSINAFKDWMISGKTKKAITQDADFKDAWIDRILGAIAFVMSMFNDNVLASQAERLASTTVAMAEAESTKAFIESVNQAVGVDMQAMISNEGLSAYIEAAAQQNTALIKSLPQEYFKDIQNAVIGGIRNGDAPSKIIRVIQEKTQASYGRAKLIARDQTAKLTSEINEKRQVNAGITHYRSVDAGDERVTGRPGGKYANAKIKCWEIARRDIGYGPGVYRWDEGASYAGQKGLHPGKHHIQCRCTASPVLPWELPGG